MKRTKFSLTSGMLSMAAAFVVATPAVAQEVSTPATAPDAAGYDEIVVTAQKREQSLSDVGITIDAIGADELKEKGITALADIAASVPTLQFSLSQNNTPILSMRGVGFYESSLASYPAVSVSLDEVPLAVPALTTLTAFDLERVEVLKGPQGTLFGQNTTGGAINYIAAKPTRDLSAGGQLTYGRFNRLSLDAFVSGPLGEAAEGRLAVRVERGDAWQKSDTRDDKNGRVENYAARAIFNFEPADNLRLSLNINGWQNKNDPIAGQFIGIGTPQAPAFVLPALATLPRPSGPRSADWTPTHEPFANDRLWQVSGRVDLDVSPDITLTSLTAYTDFKTKGITDQDGTAFRIADVDQMGSIRSFSQELRLANNGGETFRWVVGGNYSKDKVNDDIRLNSTDMSFNRRFGVQRSGTITNQVMTNYAIFGNVEFDIAENVTLKGGARYTKAKRDANSCTFGDDGNLFSTLIAGISTQLRRALFDPAAPFIPVSDLQCFTLDATTFEPSITPIPVKLSEDNVAWRAGVDYKPNDDLLLYLNVSKGYKAGSIPRSGAAFARQNDAVKQESVMAYEAGFKFDTPDRLLSMTGAAFWYDYRDKQLRNRISDPLIGLLEILTNIPKSRIRGGELQATVRPTDGLNLAVSGAYTDGVIQDFTGINFAGITDDFAGTAMPLSPKWEGRASVNYSWDAGNVRPFVGADYTARSGTYSIIGGERATFNGEKSFRIRGYDTLDLRAGIEASDGSWKAFVFGKNVTNEYYWNNVTALYDNLIRYSGAPATYGVTVNVKM